MQTNIGIWSNAPLVRLHWAFSNFFEGNLADAPDLGQTTTPGTTSPTLCDKCVGSLTSPSNQYWEDAGDGAYGFLSLSEKTRMSNRLQIS